MVDVPPRSVPLHVAKPNISNKCESTPRFMDLKIYAKRAEIYLILRYLPFSRCTKL